MSCFMRAVRYVMTHHNLTFLQLSPILLSHYHVNQRLIRNVVHTLDFDVNTDVFIATSFECSGYANVYRKGLVTVR